MFLEVRTDPHPKCPGSFNRISARRRNGEKVYLFGETRHQLKAVKRIIMRLSQKFGLPLIAQADFVGVEKLGAENADLIDCLSSPPDPYAGVDVRQAMTAWLRDVRICDSILAQEPTIDEILSVSANSQDWCLFWRCNHPDAAVRDRLAKSLAEAQGLIAENRQRLEEQRKADA
jgi:hypothetical protein